MPLLKGLSWKAQDYYNQYLELKECLIIARSRNDIPATTNAMVENMHDLLNDLNRCGVSDRDLLMLSMNVEV